MILIHFRGKSANFHGISINRFGIWFLSFDELKHVFIDTIWTLNFIVFQGGINHLISYRQPVTGYNDLGNLYHSWAKLDGPKRPKGKDSTLILLGRPLFSAVHFHANDPPLRPMIAQFNSKDRPLRAVYFRPDSQVLTPHAENVHKLWIITELNSVGGLNNKSLLLVKLACIRRNKR